MKCPACASTLSERTAGSLTIDVCETGCGGIFFDRFEIQQVDEASEEEGVALLEWSSKGDNKRPRTEQRYSCPRCNIIMMRGQFKPSIPVTVDTCPGCAGLWLDRGELNNIREAPGADADRARVALRFVWEAFAEIKSRHED